MTNLKVINMSCGRLRRSLADGETRLSSRSSSKFYESQGLFCKALEFRLKAYRALLHSPTLQDDLCIFEQLAQTTLDLVEAFERLGSLSEPERMTGESLPVCSDWHYQSTTCLKTVVGRTRKTYLDESLFETMASKWEALKGK